MRFVRQNLFYNLSATTIHMAIKRPKVVKKKFNLINNYVAFVENIVPGAEAAFHIFQLKTSVG